MRCIHLEIDQWPLRLILIVSGQNTEEEACRSLYYTQDGHLLQSKALVRLELERELVAKLDKPDFPG